MVIQVRVDDLKKVRAVLRDEGVDDLLLDIGRPEKGQSLNLIVNDREIQEFDLSSLLKDWSQTSYSIQRLRDNPECAEEEYTSLDQWNRRVVEPRLTFDPNENPSAPMISSGARPAVAILREQGVNGQIEMAAAFHLAGFNAVDVHMSDLAEGRASLNSFQGLVACGGFSYGDVLGAGRGWAQSILFQDSLREQFSSFFGERGQVCVRGLQRLPNVICTKDYYSWH